MKAVYVEYLGEGYPTVQSTNAVSTRQGIYAVHGRNGTIILPGTCLQQQCTASPTSKTSALHHLTPLARRNKVMLDEDELFSSRSTSSSTIRVSDPDNANVIPSAHCHCISCNSMFKLNTSKLKQIANKVTKYKTTNDSTLGTIVSSTFANLATAYVLSNPLPVPVCVLVVGLAFGLRNVQNIIRQQTVSNTKLYHYVEVMSCPTGCTNGGAQLTTTQINNTRVLMNKKLTSLFPLQVESNSISLLPINETREAQITMQKALLNQIKEQYHALPQCHIPSFSSLQVQYPLPFMWTAFKGIIANLQTQALNW
eukprot:UN01917